MADFNAILTEALENESCLHLVLSKRRRGADVAFDKLTVRPVEVQGKTRYQLTRHADGRQTHDNVDAREAEARVGELFGPAFEHCHLYTTAADFSARCKGEGAVRIRRKPPSRQPAPARHNRTKTYLLPEDVPCPFLTEIGVMTAAGKVRAARYSKFRQINRFLELVDDVLDALPAEGELNIVDFGCGKSYLTFALHHLLTQVRGRKVRIVGLDRNAEVIHDCMQVAERLGCAGLEFHIGDIAGHQADEKVNLAVSLHACDTATDDAIAKAVSWQSEVILAVPCCQHELAGKVQTKALAPIQQHGILHERFAAVATDALRAQALEILGYRTQVVEFIDLEHTAKNLLIRSVRRSAEEGAERSTRIAGQIDIYQRFKQSLGLNEVYLERALGPQLEELLA